ncbi:MAG TPA: hypothetical protein VME46_01075, partial [Acidimicrobiales bacterium]|nr:hypothetical protein [Acidimicrobiales bacterium]
MSALRSCREPAAGLAAPWLERLDAVVARLEAIARAGPRPGFTDPDPGCVERWDDTQVWAHLGEFVGYWVDQLLLVTGAATVGVRELAPFGRTKSDVARRAAVAAARREEIDGYLGTMTRSCDRLRLVLARLDGTAWSAEGLHPTLGAMGVPAILDR